MEDAFKTEEELFCVATVKVTSKRLVGQLYEAADKANLTNVDISLSNIQSVDVRRVGVVWGLLSLVLAIGLVVAGVAFVNAYPISMFWFFLGGGEVLFSVIIMLVVFSFVVLFRAERLFITVEKGDRVDNGQYVFPPFRGCTAWHVAEKLKNAIKVCNPEFENSNDWPLKYAQADTMRMGEISSSDEQPVSTEGPNSVPSEGIEETTAENPEDVARIKRISRRALLIFVSGMAIVIGGILLATWISNNIDSWCSPFSYRHDSGEAIVFDINTDYLEERGGVLRLPSDLGLSGQLITVKSDSFSNRDDITFLEFDGPIDIGHGAFSNCQNLTNIVVGTRASISSGCFSNCSRLHEVTILSADGIKGRAFRDSPVMIVTAPKIPSEMDRSTIRSVVARPERVASSCVGCLIDREAFFQCANATNLVINDDVEIIGAGAFAGMGISVLNLPGRLRLIGDSAFRDCTGVKEVSLPSSVAGIGALAFCNCSQMQRIEMNEGLKYIKDGAFAFCKQLTKVVVPASVEEIGRFVFRGCSNLRSIHFLGTPDTIAKECFYNLPAECMIVIPKSGIGWEDVDLTGLNVYEEDGTRYVQGISAAFVFNCVDKDKKISEDQRNRIWKLVEGRSILWRGEVEKIWKESGLSIGTKAVAAGVAEGVVSGYRGLSDPKKDEWDFVSDVMRGGAHAGISRLDERKSYVLVRVKLPMNRTCKARIQFDSDVERQKVDEIVPGSKIVFSGKLSERSLSDGLLTVSQGAIVQ